MCRGGDAQGRRQHQQRRDCKKLQKQGYGGGGGQCGMEPYGQQQAVAGVDAVGDDAEQWRQ